MSASTDIVAGFGSTAGTQSGSVGTIGTKFIVRQDSSDLTKYNVGVGNNGSGIVWVADTNSASGFHQYATTDQLFVVGRYIINGTGLVSGENDDEQSIWINPSTTDFGAGTAPTPTVTTTGADMERKD